MKIYAAIAVGHQWGNHRIIGAVVAYIGFAIAETIAASLLGSLMDKLDVFSMFNKAFTISSSYAGQQLGMLAIFLIGTVLLAIYWFVTWKLLDKRLNLE